MPPRPPITDLTDPDRYAESFERAQKVSSLSKVTRDVTNAKRYGKTAAKNVGGITGKIGKYDITEMATPMETAEIVTSVSTILDKLKQTAVYLAQGTKQLLTSTARATKDFVSQYGRALSEDISINKQNMVAMALAKSSPIFGYFASKFLETSVVRELGDKLKYNMANAVTWAFQTSKQKIQTAWRGKTGSVYAPEMDEFAMGEEEEYGRPMGAVTRRRRGPARRGKARPKGVGATARAARVATGPGTGRTAGQHKVRMQKEQLVTTAGMSEDIASLVKVMGEDSEAQRIWRNAMFKETQLARLQTTGYLYNFPTLFAMQFGQIPGIRAIGQIFGAGFKLVGWLGPMTRYQAQGKKAASAVNPLQGILNILTLTYAQTQPKLDQILFHLRALSGVEAPGPVMMSGFHRMKEAATTAGKTGRRVAGGLLAKARAFLGGGVTSAENVSVAAIQLNQLQIQSELLKETKSQTKSLKAVSTNTLQIAETAKPNWLKKIGGLIWDALMFVGSIISQLFSTGVHAYNAMLDQLVKWLAVKKGVGEITGELGYQIPTTGGVGTGKGGALGRGRLGRFGRTAGKGLGVLGRGAGRILAPAGRVIGKGVGWASHHIARAGMGAAGAVMMGGEFAAGYAGGGGMAGGLAALAAGGTGEGGMEGLLMGAGRGAMLGMTFGPHGMAIGAALGALFGFIGEKRIKQMVGKFTGAISEMWESFKNALYDVLVKPIKEWWDSTGSVVLTWLKKVGDFLYESVQTISDFLDILATPLNKMMQFAEMLGLGARKAAGLTIGGAATTARHLLPWKWGEKTPGYEGYGTITTPESQRGLATMPQYQRGGIVPLTGPALLHEGEAVVPKEKVDALGITGTEIKTESEAKRHPLFNVFKFAIKQGLLAYDEEKSLFGGGGLAGTVGGGLKTFAKTAMAGAGKAMEWGGKAIGGPAGGVLTAMGKTVGATAQEMFGIKASKNVDISGMNATVWDRFKAMASEYKARTGKDIQLNSAFRDLNKQARIYAEARPGYAAPPGRSMHNYGFALDINSGTADELDRMGLLSRYGFWRPLSKEAWHIEPSGINRAAIREAGMAQVALATAGGGGGGVTERGKGPMTNRAGVAEIQANAGATQTGALLEANQNLATQTGTLSKAVTKGFGGLVTSMNNVVTNINNTSTSVSGDGLRKGPYDNGISDILAGNLG